MSDLQWDVCLTMQHMDKPNKTKRENYVVLASCPELALAEASRASAADYGIAYMVVGYRASQVVAERYTA